MWLDHVHLAEILNGLQHLTLQMFSEPEQQAGRLLLTPCQASYAAMLFYNQTYLLLLLLQA